MNKMLNRGSFYSQSATPYGSRFEKPEAELFGTPTVCVQFGSRLRRVFELPGVESAPDQFQALLKQIEMKLDSKI
jgi:hypothetical protein